MKTQFSSMDRAKGMHMKDKPKILVVDDDSALLAGTCRILGQRGLQDSEG